MRAATGGWWRPAVEVGGLIGAGDHLGDVLDGFGDVMSAVTAPDAGVVLCVTSSPAVQTDGLLLGLGTGLHPI